jgi:hypothetical protein
MVTPDGTIVAVMVGVSVAYLAAQPFRKKKTDCCGNRLDAKGKGNNAAGQPPQLPCCCRQKK